MIKVATLALIIEDGRVLLGEKKEGTFGAGTLNGPGGKVDEDETLIQCLIRETREEWHINLVEEDLEKVARILFHRDGVPNYEVHIFRARRYEGVLSETDEFFCPEPFSVDALPTDRMLGSDREWLAKAIRGERFSANGYYKGEIREFVGIEFSDPDF